MPFNPKIFGIGLSKTGTTSLYAALMRLGIKTITYRHLQKRGLDDWRYGTFETDYLRGIKAATDLPIGTYFRELDTLYPNSRFVLTERPLDGWLASIERQFTDTPNPRDVYRRDVRFATYGVSTFHAARFAQVMADHSRAVREYFADKPGKLLIMDVFAGHGWPELCGFLDRPIPDDAFPNVKPGHVATLWQDGPDPGPED